jgi:hypothetical protein
MIFSDNARPYKQQRLFFGVGKRQDMARNQKVLHEGELYYSVALVARLLGTTSAQVRQVMIPEKLKWRNFRDNGPIYISAKSFNAYEKRLKN